MSSSPEQISDIVQLLADINLDTYLSIFLKSGYYTVSDCENVNHETLQKMGISLTGHRKRIIAKLQSIKEQMTKEYGNSEALMSGSDLQDSFTHDSKLLDSILPVSEQVQGPSMEYKTIPDSSVSKEVDHNATSQYQQTEDPNDQNKKSLEIKDHSVKHFSLDTETQLDSQNSSFFAFQGPMVENDIYDKSQDDGHKSLLKSPPTKSFILRNRPVPKLPFSVSNTFPKCCCQERHLDNKAAQESSASKPQNQSEEQNINLISPYEETFFSNSEFTKETSGDKLNFSPNSEHNEKSLERNASTSCGSVPANNGSSPSLGDHISEESIYSTMEEYTRLLGVYRSTCMPPNSAASLHDENGASSDVEGAECEISPYACFYGPSSMPTKTGWLEKLSPHRSCMFQKRWVKVDGMHLSYYSNNRDMFSKGKISLSAIITLNKMGENKFEVVTIQRTFVFRAEKEEDRDDWIGTLQSDSKSEPYEFPGLSMTEKNGYLELKGYKNKIFTVINGSKLWFSKNKQDASTGITITDLTLTMASVKNIDRKSFELSTPFRNFSLTAESEREKQEWTEAIQQSIAETLADYEVAEKIWFNEYNRRCADCRAPSPDWASISLGVVICKNCAGQHRSLGSNISKVHSLILDTTIWSNELVELFIVVGNEKVNNIWEANLLPENMLHMDSDVSQRRLFITQKYKEGRFKKICFPGFTQQELNQALCTAVTKSNILETMKLVFNGADAMCPTEDPVYNTPYLLAKMSGQCLQMEFLHHNRLSDFKTPDSFKVNGANISLFYCGFLHKASSSTSKMTINRKSKEVPEMKRWWCTIENNFLKYYENETAPVADGVIDLSEVLCLVVHPSDCSSNGMAAFTFEIYFLSERMFLFGAENVESRREWTRAIAKNFAPAVEDYLLDLDFTLLGYLYYKNSYSLNQWKKAWFALDKACLHYWNTEDCGKADTIQLKKLQELTANSSMLNGEKGNILLLVENGRTFYIHGHTMLDFTVWHLAIEKAAGTDGNALQDQQLSKNNIPIIVNSCIAFVTQYGLGSKSLYLKNGNPSPVRELLEEFKRDARSIKLKVGKHQLEDVTDVLKYFFYEIDDALLTKELYPYWISALDIRNDQERVRKYKNIIGTLPDLNKATLAALMEHLFRIQKCFDINHLDTLTLAKAFSSCLFQTNGENEQEVAVLEDLISNYVNIFNVSEDQVQQMETENRFITKWKQTQICHSGDLLIEVYVERKDPDMCVIIRVPPTMETAELTNCAMGIKNITLTEEIPWATFEVIENGELERLMHDAEKVLETVLYWSSLSDPGAAHLLVKPQNTRDIMIPGLKSSHYMMSGYMKFKEDPSKLLSGNKFQERYFVLHERKLLLYKDIKSIKHEKELPVKSCKVYAGVKKKMKPPTRWGFTIYSEKSQWHLCCDTQESQKEWLGSLFSAQHPGAHIPSSSHVQIRGTHVRQGKQMNMDLGSEDNTVKRIHGAYTPELSPTLKLRSSMLAEIFDCKEESKLTNKKKHHSLINLDNENNYIVGGKEHSAEQLTKQFPASNVKLPPNLIKELNSVLQKNKRDVQE
ncbi:arf-GAP with Rho-GAP domain, ANK repeat and PH domain-containing protein 2 isoform X2 [Xenopus laevis]|uniref:Arf-GAP with Rho-GAP domain, ANK repeat and PH domain-containing protein 2 isoform X2 n=1 Tax=Xenopus laevis TaxID=8355 RepID=A0A8J1M205_XENLA|nr:arf-GAP with Rho-GAP domain, ANK repeat and PH domain-containing protein 2 isoform X2 [Xenopus laevis]